MTNALDGISLQESGTQSLFRSRYRADAPDIDYAKSWSREFRRKNCGLQALEDNEYLFLRIRTKADGDGKLSGARYAKIYPRFETYWIDGKRKIAFHFYLNPKENDGNMEWDATKNLLRGGMRGEWLEP